MRKVKRILLAVSLMSSVGLGSLGLVTAVATPASASSDFCGTGTGGDFTACINFDGTYTYATGYGNGDLCALYPAHVELSDPYGDAWNSAAHSHWCGSPTLTSPELHGQPTGQWCSTLWEGTSSVGYTALAEKCHTY